MSKVLFTAALAVTAALAAHPAVQAGERRIQRVAISETAGAFLASGNVADVYNSQGNVETIWCWIRGSNYLDGLCFARDEKGKTFQCVATDDSQLRAIAAIGPDSTISLWIARDQARCGSIVVTNGSYSGPKRPITAETDASAVDVTGLSVQQ